MVSNVYDSKINGENVSIDGANDSQVNAFQKCCSQG